MVSPELGYTLYPPNRPTEPGYSGIDIVFCEQPTEQHFDPKTIIVWVINPSFELERLIIHHPWHQAHYHIYAGPIHLEDVHGKEVEMFTYGGEMNVRSDPESTVVEIRSQAPVLANYPEHSISRMLAEETEILLAEERAVFVEDLKTFEKRLAKVDPLELYYTSLSALLERFHHFPESADSLNTKFIHVLRVEKDYLRTAPQFGRRFQGQVVFTDLFK